MLSTSSTGDDGDGADRIARLPDGPLNPSRPLGAALREIGIGRFRDAARYVNALPYGRTTDRADYWLVLPERRGTCSTKHALLAAIAAESDVPVRLVMGVYLMSEANTPGVGRVLAAAGLEAVPEAHCYIVCSGVRIDVTWPGLAVPPPPVMQEEEIGPDDLGAHKLSRHRAFVASWADERGLDAARVWTVREACIAALGVTQVGGGTGS